VKCVGSVCRDGFFMDIVVWAGQVVFVGPKASHFGRGGGGGESGRGERKKEGAPCGGTMIAMEMMPMNQQRRCEVVPVDLVWGRSVYSAMRRIF